MPQVRGHWSGQGGSRMSTKDDGLLALSRLDRMLTDTAADIRTLRRAYEASQAARATAERLLEEAQDELDELRQRDRVISKQLEDRSQGRDALTQTLIAERDAWRERLANVIGYEPSPLDEQDLAGVNRMDRVVARGEEGQ